MSNDASLQSTRTAFKLCRIATAVFLAYACLLSIYSVAGFPTSQQTHSFWPWLGNKPVGEDGFYMLTVADNIATTHQITYNYGRAATGIQPLSTIVFAGIAWVVHLFNHGSWMLIRAMIVEGSVLFVCFSWMMAYVVARLGPASRFGTIFTIAFFLTLCDFDLFRLFTYGLETGIYLLLILACFWLTWNITQSGRSSWKDVFLLGITGGFAGLARIDFGIIFAILLVFFLIKRISTLVQTAASGLIALVITSPWFLFVHSVSGSWLPTSGKAESRIINVHDWWRLLTMAKALLVHVCPWIYSNLPLSVVLFLGIISLLLMAFLISRAVETRAWLTDRRGYFVRTAPWIIAIVCFATIYTTLFAVVTFYVRYTSFLFILAVPIIALVLAEQPRVVARPALVIVPLVAFFTFYCGSTLHTGNIGNNWLIDAGYIRQYYPTAHVAAFQSGTIGYFDRNVDNLDGKLNLGALEALLHHRMDSFIDQENIEVLVEWPSYIHEILPADYVERNWQPCPRPLPETLAICLVRKSLVHGK
jgi:hypothetical protein